MKIGQKIRDAAHKIPAIMGTLARDRRGAVAAYAAVFSMVAVGAGAIMLDTGRFAVLRSQLQDRADAGALAGAAQLDGRSGAQARAAAVAIDAMTRHSALTSNGTELSVQSVTFYSLLSPPTLATGDEDSKFIEVTMAPRQFDYLFRPVFASVASTSTSASVQAQAAATMSPFICHAPPLMICDPQETDSTMDLSSTDMIGRQVVVKPPLGGGSWAPGNFGLLALPDGSKGANDIEKALKAVQPEDCYGLDVGTAPGVKVNKVKDGMNARFYGPNPAPNVVNYPKDTAVAAGTASFGAADWDLSGYWFAKHGTTVPADLSGATRYQVYLYELGLEFARKGRQTIYPLAGPVPGGFTVVSPASAQIPTSASHPTNPDYDGVPDAAPVAWNGHARRLLQVAVLRCIEEGVRGSHSYPTHGNYVELFVTQEVPDAPQGAIYAEIVRTLTPGSNPDFHANVHLVQ